MNGQLTKGDLQVADRLLDNEFTTIEQWERDVNISLNLGLIEFEVDVDGGYMVCTELYNELSEKFQK